MSQCYLLGFTGDVYTGGYGTSISGVTVLCFASPCLFSLHLESVFIRCFVRVGLRQIVENIIDQQNRVATAGPLYQMMQTEETSGGGYFNQNSGNP